MVEHEVWKGPMYCSGIKGQRIAIVGHSHYLEADDPDRSTITQETVRKVISGVDVPAFYKAIAGYFGYTNLSDFWNRVMFFNFIPDVVGTPDRRHAFGTREQIERGQARVLRLMPMRQPQKMLVFSKKAWTEFPPTSEERADGLTPMLVPQFPAFSRGTYDVGGHIVMAFGLRHPQGAKTELMRRAVEHILGVPFSTA